VSTIIGRGVNWIAVENRRRVPFLAAFVVALQRQVPKAIRTVNDLLELSFAEFAGVPYEGPVSRQQWEELWESEAALQQRLPDRHGLWHWLVDAQAAIRTGHWDSLQPLRRCLPD